MNYQMIDYSVFIRETLNPNPRKDLNHLRKDNFGNMWTEYNVSYDARNKNAIN